MDVDEALTRLGKVGKWHIIYYTIISLAAMVPAAFHMLAIVFIGADPGYHCKLPGNRQVEDSVPKELINDKYQNSKCRMYDVTENSTVTNSTPIVECRDGFDYNLELYGTTIITDFELVCEKSVLAETTQAVFVVGVVAGAVFFTWLSDKVGRKPAFLSAQWGMVIIGIICALAPEYNTFIFTRFFSGAMQQGIILPGFVMACELFPAKQRTQAGMGSQCFWPLGMVLIALMAYFIDNWRWVQLGITLPGLLTIPLYWILPETIPYLIANRKFREAEDILRSAAKMNGVEMPEVIFVTPEMAEMLAKEDEEKMEARRTCWEQMHPRNLLRKLVDCCSCKKNDEESKGPKPPTIIDVIKSRRLMLNTLVMACLWLVNGLVYYGLNLSTGSIAGNIYLNFFIGGMVELFAYASCIFILARFGRRWPVCIFHIIAGVSLLLTLPIPNVTSGGTNLVPLIITLGMIGKAGITASFGSVFLYAPEIYPTTVRGLCLGICSIGGRIGNILAPYSAFVTKYYWWFPGVVFGILSLAVGVMTLYLPETLNRPLPQNIEEAEKFTRTAGKATRLSDPDRDRTAFVMEENGNTADALKA